LPFFFRVETSDNSFWTCLSQALSPPFDPVHSPHKGEEVTFCFFLRFSRPVPPFFFDPFFFYGFTWWSFSKVPRVFCRCFQGPLTSACAFLKPVISPRQFPSILNPPFLTVCYYPVSAPGPFFFCHLCPTFLFPYLFIFHMEVCLLNLWFLSDSPFNPFLSVPVPSSNVYVFLHPRDALNSRLTISPPCFLFFFLMLYTPLFPMGLVHFPQVPPLMQLFFFSCGRV